jgi:hypothetical protein
MTDTQTYTVTVEFKTEHKPGTPRHLEVVLASYLKAKGIVLIDGKIIV